MSKSSELDKTVKRYILDQVDGSGYGVELTNDQDRIDFLKTTFYQEYGWAVDRYGETKALAEWFAGLPSACTVDFYHHEILKLAYKWGSLPENATGKQKNKILDNWFNFIANKTGQLFRGYHVKLPTSEADKARRYGVAIQ